MKKEDSLHQLIHSLDSSEKRLFKMSVSVNNTTKNSQYIELFDALSKLDEYDELRLKKKLKHANTKKNLAQAKKYLKDLILKSMRDIDDESAADKVNILLKEASFLSKKNLFKEQWKKLEKAKQIANKYELYADELEILDSQMKYLIRYDFDRSLQWYDDYKIEKLNLVEKVKLYNDLVLSKNIVFQLLRKSISKASKEDILYAESQVKLFKEEKILNLDSFNVSIIYYTLISNFHYLKADYEERVKSRYKLVEAYKLKPYFIKENPNSYLTTVFNYIGSISLCADFPLMKKELDSLDVNSFKAEGLRIEFLQNYIIYSSMYYLNTGKLIEGKILETKYSEELSKNELKFNPSSLMTIYYNFSLVFFLQDDFDNSLNWLEKLADFKIDIRNDLKSFAKILVIICFYEKGELLIITSLVRSIRRQFKLSDYEEFLIKFILKLNNSNKDDKNVIYKLFYSELNNFNDKYIGKKILLMWLKSKLTQSKIKDIYLQSI